MTATGESFLDKTSASSTILSMGASLRYIPGGISVSGFKVHADLGAVVAGLSENCRIEPVVGAEDQFVVLSQDGPVLCILPASLLGKYLDQLNEEALPELMDLPPQEWLNLKIDATVALLDELIAADVTSSLRSILLIEDSAGQVDIQRQYGPPRRPFMAGLEAGAYWRS